MRDSCLSGGGGPAGGVAAAMQSALDYYSRPASIRTNFLAKASYSDRHLHHHHGSRNGGGREAALYRSNSSLELMGSTDHYHLHNHHQDHLGRATSPALRREYGSHGSIDVIGGPSSLRPSESFFEMLQEARPALVGNDQRSPGPQEYLARRHDDTDDRSSPKSARRKFHKFWGGRGGGPNGGTPGRGEDGGGSNSSQGHTAVTSTSSTGGNGDESSDGRHRRRAFAHYDCQSVTANLGYAARLRGLLAQSRRRNTATGASAASVGRSVTPDGAADSGDEDHGDGHCNDLIESCPYFRNEVGGEEERVVWLTRHKGPGRGQHRPAMACGIAVLEFPLQDTHWKASTCPYSSSPRPIEAVDPGAHYYRNYFYAKDHQNWFGMDENLGPVAISLRRERVEPSPLTETTSPSSNSSLFRYRVVIRTSELLTLRGSVLEDAIPNIKPSSSSKSVLNTKEVLEYVAPEVQLSCLRLGIVSPQTEDALLKLDEQGISHHYKVGIMYCKAGQGNEEQMYNNQDAGAAFTEFLDIIGQKVRLKSFDKYRAGLDNKTDSTGLYSVYAQYQDCEIMFHVSTLLPFTPNNRQQLLRKRHIGNDIVTIVFQEPGALPFTPKVIRSQFQHVFIVVRAVNPCSENTHYSVSVSRSKEVPVFGPPIPEGGTFPKSKAFTDFLLAKVINAENAAHRSEKFATMAVRTRQEYLKDLVTNYTTSTVVESSQKFSMLSFSTKKKERWRPRILPDSTVRGALCWLVLLDDSSRPALTDCFLAISSDSLVLIEETSREIVFAAPCKSILGWSTNTNSLRVYYHQGECITFHMKEGGERDELMEVVVRLRSVTDGSGAQELTLKRNPLGQLGFHVQPDGVVTQVEHKGLAWTAGLRQGARLVEICKVAVSTLSHDQMIDLLKTSVAVTVTVIPSFSDGSIRKGCSEKICKYSSNFDGDYENITTQQDARAAKTARQQAVSKRNERSFSPPRSSNSSGYGTGSSSKSFTGGERFSNIEGGGTRISSCKQDQWFNQKVHLQDELEAPPPPVPPRLSSANNVSKPNTYSMVDANNHDFKVGEIVTTCLMKAERSHEVRRQLERNNQDYHPPQPIDYNVTASHYHEPLSRDKSSSLSLESSNRLQTIVSCDDHSTDTSSTSDRLLAFPSEDDLSGGSSPAGLRRSKTTGCIASLRTESPRSQGSQGGRSSQDSPRSRDSAPRLRPSAHRSAAQRNSATLSTLQQDLIRLINPDSESDSSIPIKESKVKVSDSMPDMRKYKSKENLSHSPPVRDKNEKTGQEVIVTVARPATVISTSSSPAPQPSKSKDERSTSGCVTKTLVNKQRTLLVPNAQEMDWPSLVDTATRALLDVEHQPVNNITVESLPIPNATEEELRKLERMLSREKMRNLSLEDEVRSLRDEVRSLREKISRLQQEAQGATQQLHRFTDWFFQTIDKQ